MVVTVERLRTVLAERYAVGRELGRGGMATVYLAHDLKHGRQVAIKVLRPELAESLGPGRFLREIRIASRLTHPNILPVHDSGTADGLLFYVTPYVAGESLGERLRRDGPLPLGDAVRITREIADALAYAHAEDIVHRDIKPGNILLEAGHAVVADFGLARAIHAAAADDLSSAGLALGTPLYMSPEQSSGGDQIDGRSDVYSLGCVLYEMLAGEPPFSGPSAQAITAKHLQLPPPSLRTVRPNVPVPIEAAINRALEKVPAERFQTAQEFAEALTTDLPGSGGRLRKQFSTRRLLMAAVAAGVAALALVLASRRNGSVTVPSAIGIVVVPFEGTIQPGGSLTSAPPALHTLFADAVEWVPGVRAINGASLLGISPGWRSLPLPQLLRGARDLGGQYLITGAVLPVTTGSGSRVSVELYAVNSGERLMRADERSDDQRFDLAVNRLALQSMNALAERGSLALGPRRALLTATSSAAALGHLLRGQDAFWRGEFDAAATDFRAAVQADSSCGPAYLRLSMAEYWRFDYRAALAAAQAGLRRDGRLDQHWINLLQAQRQFVIGLGDSAVTAFQQVVLENPEDIDGWLGLAEALFHYGALTGHVPSDARSALEHVTELDSAFAPIYDHLLDLAIYRRDSAAAERYLLRLPPAGEPTTARRAAIALSFGSSAMRSETLQRLRSANRQVLSELVAILMHGSFDLAAADTVASLLLGAERTPDDRLRGAEYRLAALGGQGKAAAGLALWQDAAVDQRFDAWVVQAYLAGQPAVALAAPMFEWANSLVKAGRSPDFRLSLMDLRQQAFQALVHRVTLEGDSSQVTFLLQRLDSAPTGNDPSDPTREALRSSLLARLAMLAGDTLQTIDHLQRSLARIAQPFTVYFPLSAMAPQRLLLGELLIARGADGQARRWLNSFNNSWSIGDVLYNERLRKFRGR